MAWRDIDSLRKEYFSDPSQFCDSRNNQRGPRSPNFKNQQTGELPWTDGGHYRLWAQQDLRKSRVKNGEFYVKKAPGEDEVHRQEFYIQKAGGEDDTLTVHQEFLDPVALLDVIKTCGKHRDLPKGSRLHALILKRGLLTNDIYVGTALLGMYAKCGMLKKAQEVFD
eukprot:c15272_g1_i2 orf=157-657(+)